MNWEAIGAVGETVGALAVLLTLVYLAMQIRQNTKSVQAAAVDSANTQLSRIREVVIANADLASVYRKGNEDPGSLGADDLIRYRLLMHVIYTAISNSLTQTSVSGFSASESQVELKVLSRVMATSGGRWFWDVYRDEFDEAFRNRCDGLYTEIFDDQPPTKGSSR